MEVLDKPSRLKEVLVVCNGLFSMTRASRWAHQLIAFTPLGGAK